MALLPVLCVCENVECLTLNGDNIHYVAKFGTLFCTELLLWKRLSNCLCYATLKRRIRGNWIEFLNTWSLQK